MFFLRHVNKLHSNINTSSINKFHMNIDIPGFDIKTN